MYLDKMNYTNPTENMNEIWFLLRWWYRADRVFPSEKCESHERDLLMFEREKIDWLIYWLIDWFVFNVQRAIFQLYSGRE